MPKILSDEEVQEIKKRTKIQSNWDKETVLDLIATIESETDLFNRLVRNSPIFYKWEMKALFLFGFDIQIKIIDNIKSVEYNQS
jgi:hypothetical protein